MYYQQTTGPSSSNKRLNLAAPTNDVDLAAPTNGVDLVAPTNGVDLVAPICVHRRMLTRCVRLPICIQIINILDLHFQSQRLKLSTLGSSYVIMVSCIWRQIGQTLQFLKQAVAYGVPLAYLHLIVGHSQGHQDHAHFDRIFCKL